jgi:hypothetical protein
MRLQVRRFKASLSSVFVALPTGLAVVRERHGSN